MNIHVTFEFDYNNQTYLTDYLDSQHLTYQIIETEITINHLNPDQLADLAHFLNN